LCPTGGPKGGNKIENKWGQERRPACGKAASNCTSLGGVGIREETNTTALPNSLKKEGEE